MKAKITFFITLFACFHLFGQVKEHEVKLRDKIGNPKLIKFKETKVSNQKEGIEAFLKQQFKTDDGTEFRAKPHRIEKSQYGFKSQKLQQYYKGIKVEFGQLNIVSKNGNLKSMNGNVVPINNLDVNPTLSEEQALQFALNHVKAIEYAWQNSDKENLIKELKNTQNATYFPIGKLVIIKKNRFSDSDLPTLAYKFDIYALNPMSRKHYYVDANNGEIIFEDTILKHVEGIAETRYSGKRTIETEQVNGQFRLRDQVRGNGVITYNNFNQGNHVNTDYTDNNNNWTAAEYNNVNRDNAGLDAHWGAMMTYDYFSQTHNRNSIDNNGYQLRNYVNANLQGWGFPNSDNAFWDGNVMTYGMGTTLDPLVSIDIIAHEIGHGLDEKTSDLIYQNESGAIDEGLSDVWGAMVEFFAAPEKQTYNLGEDIGLSLRSMSNPKSRNDPDTYGGDFWFTGTGDNGGVHTNSGIFNHWFYLLAEGSSTTDEINDNGDTFSINGIGKLAASRIVYRAQTVYFTSTTNYAQARELTLQAAEDLYGENSLETIQTCQSWFAVGVGNNECIENFEIVGTDQLCGSQNATYTILNVPSGSNVNWSVNYALTILSSNNNSITVKPRYTSTNRTGVITANINGVIQRKNVFIGKPTFLTSINYTSNYGTISLNNLDEELQGVTNIQWQKISGNGVMVLMYDSNNNPNGALIHGSNGSPNWSFYGKITITNNCGATIKYFNMSRSGGDCPRCTDDSGPIPVNGFLGQTENQSEVKIYPNPADNVLKINLLNDKEGNVKVYNLQGQLIQNITISSNQIELNTSSLENGVYFIDIIQGNEKVTKKIIVQH